MQEPCRPLVVDGYQRAQPGPIPEKSTVGVREPKAAVRGGVAPIAAPVVVVKACPVAGEVLREQHVLQVVAAGPEPRDADGVAVHGFIRHTPADGVHAEGRWPWARAV